MKVCFPILEDQGLQSRVFGHFGSAPAFLIVDTDSSQTTAVSNGDRVHQHGACNPVAGLGGHEVDAIVVGGIGAGALRKLNAAGLRVFRGVDDTIAANVALFNERGLPEFQPSHTCGGHGHSQGCSH